MSEQNGTGSGEGGAEAPEGGSGENWQDKYQQADARAKRFEGQLVDLQRQFESFSKLGDPDSIRGKLEDYDNLKRDKATGSPEDLDAWKKDTESEIRGELQKDIDGLKSAVAEKDKKLNELQVVDKTMSQIGGMFNDDTHDFIKQYVREGVKLDESGDLIVHDGEGNPRYSPGNASVKMTVSEYAEELAGKHPSMAKAQNVAGGKQGVQKAGSGGAGIDINRFSKMSKEERAKLPVDDRRKLSSQLANEMRLVE